MSYKDNMFAAYFRGVPFYVDSSAAKFGRRVKLIQYWRKDNPRLYDYGPNADVYSIEGHIIQNLGNDFDYFEIKNKLISVLKKAGAGTLIHPYYGTLKVGVLEPATFQESTDEGGIVRISMTFVQWGKSEYPAAKKDYEGLVDAGAFEGVEAIEDSWFDKFVATGAYVASLSADLSKGIQQIKGVLNAVKGTVASVMNAVAASLSALESLISSVLGSPCDMAELVTSASKQITGAAGMLGDSVQGGIIGGCTGTVYEGRTDAGQIQELDGTSIPPTLGGSLVDNLIEAVNYDEANLPFIPSEQAENRALIINSFKGNMLINASKIAIRIDFNSHEEMITLVQKLSVAIETFLLRLGDSEFNFDTLYIALDNLRAIFVQMMYEKNTDLVKEVDYTAPAGVQTTLELAYNKYEDVSRDQEIFDRNKVAIKHPGFLPGGDAIRILDE